MREEYIPVERADTLALTLATSSSSAALLDLIAVDAMSPPCLCAGVREPINKSICKGTPQEITNHISNIF